MGTKSHWRKGKLRFYDKPMFSSVTANTTIVKMTTDQVTTEKVLVSGDIVGGTFTTENDMHFKAVCGGMLSSSSSYIDFHLNWGSTAPASGNRRITSVRSSTGKSMDSYKAFHVEFDGRIVGLRTSSGQITATGKVITGWSTAQLSVRGCTQSTGGAANNKMATSNLQMLAPNTPGGINISTVFHSTRGVAAGSTHHLHCTYGYIKYYS